jgi:hypothetical protein
MKKNKGLKTVGMVLGTMIIAGALVFGPSLLASGVVSHVSPGVTGNAEAVHL